LLRHLFVVVMLLQMVFGRFIGVASGLLPVAMGDEGLMRGTRIFLLRVMVGGAAMVRRRLLMMCRCGCVVFGACANPSHISSNSQNLLARPLSYRIWRDQATEA
jgi:hypothetical protein